MGKGSRKLKEKVCMLSVLALALIVAPVSVSAQPTPFVISGYVFYENSTACNNPTVNTSNTNTCNDWNATTNESYNYYRLVLANGTDVNATEILRFNVTSPDGSQTNVTEHTVTLDELNNGCFEFNITLAPYIVINEFLSDPSAGSDWIELYNPANSTVNLMGWTINDSVNQIKSFTSSDNISADGYLMVEVSNRLNKDGDTITLLKNGVVVDQVAYGTAGEAPVPPTDKSTGRFPSGVDTNNDSTDFIVFDTPTPGAPNTIAPNITSFAPPSPVTNNEGESRTSNITIDQTVNVTWQINGTQVGTNTSVISANYTNTSAVAGYWNVSAIVTNANGTDIQTWWWTVNDTTPPVSAQGNPGAGCTSETKYYGTINGSIYFEQYGWMQFGSMTKTFNDVPAGIKIARVYTGVWGGSPGKGGDFNVTINGYTSPTYPACDPCPQYGNCESWQCERCDTVNTSECHDYVTGCNVHFISYNATPYIVPGSNTVTVKTTGNLSCPRGGWDGRIYLIALLVVYEDASMPEMTYWINEGAPYMEKDSACDGPDDHLNISFYFNGTHISNPAKVNYWTLSFPHAANASTEPAYTRLNGNNIGVYDHKEKHGGYEVLYRWDNIPAGYLNPSSNLFCYHNPNPWYERVNAAVLVVLTMPRPGICGDVNDDGIINMDDVMTLWYDYADYPTPGAYTISNEWAADVTGDGDINMDDVMTLWYDYADYPYPGAYEVNCKG